MKGFGILTQPAEEPVTLAEFKLWAKISTTADDTLIPGILEGARKNCEEYLHRSFVTTTRELTLDAFPTDKIIELPYAKVSAINFVKYLDANGTLQTLSTDNYQAVMSSEPARIYLRGTIPATGDYLANVQVSYDCGYGDAEDVPEVLKVAIKMMALHLYENRAATSVLNMNEVPLGVAYLLDREAWRSSVW